MTILTKMAEEFREYMIQGYAGGECGLRCSLCDRKYSGVPAVKQLCPECKASQALNEAYEIGYREGGDSAAADFAARADKD